MPHLPASTALARFRVIDLTQVLAGPYAAYQLGLDGGWMCAPLFCPEIVRRQLGLAEGLVPHALVAVGYAARDPVRRPRLPLDRLIVSWE